MLWWISCIEPFHQFHWLETKGAPTPWDKIIRCLKYQPAKSRVIQKFLCIYELLEKHWYQDSADVSMDQKKLIFEPLVEKSRRDLNFKACKELCAHRGDQILKRQDVLMKLVKKILKCSKRVLRQNLTEEFFSGLLQQTFVIILINSYEVTSQVQVGQIGTHRFGQGEMPLCSCFSIYVQSDVTS